MVVFKEVVVPTDFSEFSLRGLDYAVEIAQKFGSSLRLVYVIEPVLQAADVSWTSVDFEQMNKAHRESAEQQIAKLAEDRVPPGVEAHTDILFGKPFMEIVRYATEHNADLIVMATHGRGAISHILMGSTAEKVVRKAPCPVLTVKHPKHLFAMP